MFHWLVEPALKVVNRAKERVTYLHRCKVSVSLGECWFPMCTQGLGISAGDWRRAGWEPAETAPLRLALRGRGIYQLVTDNGRVLINLFLENSKLTGVTWTSTLVP